MSIFKEKKVGIYIQTSEKFRKKWKRHCLEWNFTSKERIITLMEEDIRRRKYDLNLTKYEQTIQKQK